MYLSIYVNTWPDARLNVSPYIVIVQIIFSGPLGSLNSFLDI